MRAFRNKDWEYFGKCSSIMYSSSARDGHVFFPTTAAAPLPGEADDDSDDDGSTAVTVDSPGGPSATIATPISVVASSSLSVAAGSESSLSTSTSMTVTDVDAPSAGVPPRHKAHNISGAHWDDTSGINIQGAAAITVFDAYVPQNVGFYMFLLLISVLQFMYTRYLEGEANCRRKILHDNVQGTHIFFLPVISDIWTGITKPAICRRVVLSLDGLAGLIYESVGLF
jgi:hypothetical protein